MKSALRRRSAKKEEKEREKKKSGTSWVWWVQCSVCIWSNGYWWNVNSVTSLHFTSVCLCLCVHVHGHRHPLLTHLYYFQFCSRFSIFAFCVISTWQAASSTSVRCELGKKVRHKPTDWLREKKVHCSIVHCVHVHVDCSLLDLLLFAVSFWVQGKTNESQHEWKGSEKGE